MISRLKGILIKKNPTYAILDVNGVGYSAFISLRSFEKLPDEGKEVALFISLRLKEDTIELYGFAAEEEKEMFDTLITVSGIGPKLALNILSGISYDELSEAIRSNNIGRLIAIPGIGKKTAERILIDLRDKIDKIFSKDTTRSGDFNRNDAIQALTTLGYNLKASEKIIDDIIRQNKDISLEEIIKLALKYLNK